MCIKAETDDSWAIIANLCGVGVGAEDGVGSGDEARLGLVSERVDGATERRYDARKPANHDHDVAAYRQPVPAGRYEQRRYARTCISLHR